MVTEKIRVLQFITSFMAGGTERHVANLLQQHDDSRFEFHLACFSASGSMLPRLPGLSGRVAEFPIRRLYGPKTWAQQWGLLRYLRKHRIQVLHTYGFYPNCFAIPVGSVGRVPAIVGSIRDIGASWTPSQRRVERWVCTMADAMLVNAGAVKQVLVEAGYRGEKIDVIRNGIDVDAFARPQGPPRLRQDLGIPPHAPLVGVVSRIDRVKGLEHFIDAAAVVHEAFPDARFVVIGESYPSDEHRAYHRSLQRRVEESGLEEAVFFAGRRSDIAEVLSELTVSVLSSLTEGLSNVLLESMAAGLPVVATRVGGTPEVVKDEVNGLLVDPGDPDGLAHAIERLLSDPRLARGLADQGRRTARTDFSIDRMVRSTEQYYLELLRQRNII